MGTGALHVDVHPGDGPPMLLVHGMMAGRALWGANLEALRSVVTPVVLELYGHGRSPSPDDPAAYHPDAYVEAFDAVRASLGAERWFVAGHSLGAALVLRYALDRSDQVMGAVFTNSASALADERWRSRVLATVEAEGDRIEAAGRPGLVEHRLNPVRSFRLVPSVREALAADQPLLEPAGIAGTMRWTTPATSVRERVHRLAAPCLVVAGTKEAAFAEPAAYAERTIPDVEVRRVHAGHSPNAEVPEVFDEAITAFVRRLTAR